MKWTGILLLVCMALAIATYSKKADRQETERELKRAAALAERQDTEQRFAEATGATRDWLAGAGCDDFQSPLYLAQKAIQDTDKVLLTIWLPDVVLIDNKPQLTAKYHNTGGCLFSPNIDVQAIMTDDQAADLMARTDGRFDEYLLALDVSATHPQDRGILVTGTLIDIAERESKE